MFRYLIEDSNPRSNESSPTDDVPEKQRHVPSGWVTDPSNIGELQLSSHQQAHKATTSTDKDAKGLLSSTRKCQADDVESDVDDVDVIGTSGGPSSTSKGKKPAQKHGKKSAGKAADAAEPMEIDTDGMLKDIKVQEIEEITEAPSKQNKIRDVEYFFSQPYIDSEGKRVCNCTLCIKKPGMPKPKVNELSMLCHHCQSFHKATYQKWARDNGFASVLPDDCKELKAAKIESERQTQLDPHLKEHEKKEVVLPYTDELF
ncbi:hypothetical protein EDD85DRAFT_959598 [Armillaria nabsnona]|nr:hypothetical protein EDD85DRAFT_959598 [Armillaria nabsnona]